MGHIVGNTVSVGVLTDTLKAVTTTLKESQPFISETWGEPMIAALAQGTAFFSILARVPGLQLGPMLGALVVVTAEAELARNFAPIAELFRNSLLWVAERGTSGFGFAHIMNPSEFMDKGLAAFKLIVESKALSKLTLFATEVGTGMGLVLNYAFMMMAIGCMFSVMQWYVAFLVLALLIPFMPCPFTRRLADVGFSAFMRTSAWLFSAAAFGAIILPSLDTVANNRFGTDHDIAVMCTMVCFYACCMTALPMALGAMSSYAVGTDGLSTLISAIGKGVGMAVSAVAAASGGTPPAIFAPATMRVQGAASVVNTTGYTTSQMTSGGGKSLGSGGPGRLPGGGAPKLKG
mgnify:FL=1